MTGDAKLDVPLSERFQGLGPFIAHLMEELEGIVQVLVQSVAWRMVATLQRGRMKAMPGREACVHRVKWPLIMVVYRMVLRCLPVAPWISQSTSQVVGQTA